MLVRIAALAAVDAPSVSYLTNLEAIAEVGIDADRVRGVLAAIAPIVGAARVASATARSSTRSTSRSRSRRLVEMSATKEWHDEFVGWRFGGDPEVDFDPGPG